MVPEAPLEQAKSGGLVPKGEGWFVLNAREVPWGPGEGRGAYSDFEGEHEFSQVGVHLCVLAPGDRMAMYHWEADQENFLVLSGECLLLVEGEERPLKAWDFIHCPPGTDHVFVGAGDGPCTLLAVGSRASEEIVYPVSEVAARHGASVETETPNPKEAYAPFGRSAEAPYRGQLDA